MAETKKKSPGRPKKVETQIETEPVQPEIEQKPAERVFSEADVQSMIAKAVAEALAKQQTQSAPQIVQIAADVEKVQFLFQAEVADDNVYTIGPNGMYGRIVGKTGMFYVPKADLSRVMDGMFRLMLAKRWIIVLDGLTDEEKEAYGVNYRDGEILSKRAFSGLVSMGDEILDVYPKLCAGHREMVAKRFYEAYMAGRSGITRERVVELNRMSKELGSEKGDFAAIIEAMNAHDLAK